MTATARDELTAALATIEAECAFHVSTGERVCLLCSQIDAHSDDCPLSVVRRRYAAVVEMMGRSGTL